MCLQDFLTSAFLLTSKDKFFTRAEFAQLCSYMGDARSPVDLPTPALIKPMELWTGKQLFSVMVRPNAQTRCALRVKHVTGRGRDSALVCQGCCCEQHGLYKASERIITGLNLKIRRTLRPLSVSTQTGWGSEGCPLAARCGVKSGM